MRAKVPASARIHAQAPAAVDVERVDDGLSVRVEPQYDLEVAHLGHKRHRVRRADHGDGVSRGLLDGGLQLLEFGPRARRVEAVQEEVHIAVGPFGVGPRPRRAKPAPEPAHLGARTLVAQAQVLEDEKPQLLGQPALRLRARGSGGKGVGLQAREHAAARHDEVRPERGREPCRHVAREAAEVPAELGPRRRRRRVLPRVHAGHDPRHAPQLGRLGAGEERRALGRGISAAAVQRHQAGSRWPRSCRCVCLGHVRVV